MAVRGLSIAVICVLAIVACTRQLHPRAPRPGHTANDAQINLGRQLFYDRRLSGPGTLACASCHQQQHAFSDNLPTAVNAQGERLLRNTPGLLNSAQRTAFGWANPELHSLEEQISSALFAAEPPEMDVAGREREVLDRLQADASYGPLFRAAFPAAAEPMSWANISSALAAFTSALSASNSPYDRAMQGDSTELSLAAQRGMALFSSAGLACSHCHRDLAGPQAEATYLANGAGRSADKGLAELSGNPADAYRFRVPPLRNVATTAPYMHDGSLQTLDAVIRFYESGGRAGAGPEVARATARHPLVAGFVLSDTERSDLSAFLNALTDQTALTDPSLSDPNQIGQP